MSKKWSRQTVSQCCGQPHEVCARCKQGAPWQFDKLQRHLGVITLPLVTVIVIICGPNVCSVIYLRMDCVVLLGTLSFSSEHDVVSYKIYLHFQPVSSSYLPTLITVSVCSETPRAAWLSRQCSAPTGDPAQTVCFHSFLSLIYLFHIIKLPSLRTTIFAWWNLKKCPSTPSWLNKVNKTVQNVHIFKFP